MKETMICIAYAVVALAVMIGFIHEVNLARRIRNMNQEWTLDMTVILVLMSVFWPAGIFFLWLLTNSNTNRYDQCDTE